MYSSPAVSDDATVFVGSLTNTCTPSTRPIGALRWRYQTGGDVDSSPAVSGIMPPCS